MTCHSQVELRDLQLATDIGTYGPGDVVPEAHLLDLTLTIDPAHVLIARDDMALVFDYDPLVAQIAQLAQDGHYETQERLMTRIASACASYDQVIGLQICLRKSPVLAGTGSLGVRLTMEQADLAALRASEGSQKRAP